MGATGYSFLTTDAILVFTSTSPRPLYTPLPNPIEVAAAAARAE